MAYFKYIINIFIALLLFEGVIATKVSNPIIWSDVPDDDIIRVGDTYYMVSTTMFFNPGAPIMKSTDLVSWKICNYVYDTLADGDVQTLSNGKHDYSHGQWATSLRYHEGTFYVFFGSYGTNKSYIFKTKDIENGTWTRTELPGMYHDASMLIGDKGKNYLVYGAGGEIRIKELNSDMTGFQPGGADKVLFKTNLSGLAGEGSHIQKIGDYYYIFIIAWPNGKGRIEICYRSKDILGFYENKTVLDSGVGSYGSGAAQGGIVDTPDGKWYGLLFQDHGAVGRIPVLVPVTWQDDWPMMGVNGKAPVTFEIDGEITGTKLAINDEFDYDSNKLALEWQWNHNPDNKAWSVTERPGWLRLKNEHIASEILRARNTLTMRTEGPSCNSVVKLDASKLNAGDYAGLSAFQYNYGNVGVYVTNSGEKHVYMAENGNTRGEVMDSRNNIVEEAPMTGDEIYLKVDFHFNDITNDGSSSNNIDKANFFYSYDGKDWKKIGKEIGMTYDLKLFTGYRSGIYSYPTSKTGGYADFDFFHYERKPWNPATIDEPVEPKKPVVEPTEPAKPTEPTEPTKPVESDGYIFYHTFENDEEDWQPRGASKIAVKNGSLFCSEREANWCGAGRTLSPSVFKPGTEYSFSVDVKYDEGPASQVFYLTLQYENGSDEVQYDKISAVEVTKGQWTKLYNTNYKIPKNASDMIFYVETDEGEDSFYVNEAIAAAAGTKLDGKSSDSKNSSECFSSALGYKCCTKTATVIYEDEDGKWGVEDNDWCGLNTSAAVEDCWAVELGYPCCKSSKAAVIYSDEDGDWSVENNEWCGII